MKKTLAVLAVALLLGADSKDDVKKERKKLEGTWQLVTEVADGNDRPDDYIKSIKVYIEADGNWRVENDGKVMFKGTSVMDPAAKPKTIDYTLTSEESKGMVVKAIYELDGDTFKQCLAVNKDRPTTFESKAGSGWIYATYKRVK